MMNAPAQGSSLFAGSERIGALYRQITEAHAALDAEEPRILKQLLPPTAVSVDWQYDVESGDEGDAIFVVNDIWFSDNAGTRYSIPLEDDYRTGEWTERHSSPEVDRILDRVANDAPESDDDALAAALARDLGVTTEALEALISIATSTAYRNARRYQLETISLVDGVEDPGTASMEPAARPAENQVM
jgi:hypothetical protein